MKKLVFLLTAVVVTAFSSSVFAQSTGTKPAPGATHSYFVTDNVNTSVQWSVTKGDLVTATTDATIVSPNSDTTDITWASSVTADDWYYITLVETDTTTGCSNTKVLPVQIVESPFYLTLAATNATQCYDGAVVASISGTDPGVVNYDHGNATLEFKVTPTGLSSSYSGYSFNIGMDFNAYGGTLDASNVSVSSNASISGGTVTVTDNNEVTITYVVDNQTIFTNSAAADAQDFTATATISNGVAINGVAENGTDGVYVDETDVARPNTSGIGTN